MNRSTSIDIGVTLGLFVFAIITWEFFASSQRARLSPKAGTTFERFVADMPPPKHLACVDDGTGKKVIWVGEVASLSFPSGPSCYVFDDNGILVRYNTSTGDGERTTKDLAVAYKADQISIDEVMAFLPHRTRGR